jgi:vault protein inter-alpha-trypsin-like protein
MDPRRIAAAAVVVLSCGGGRPVPASLGNGIERAPAAAAAVQVDSFEGLGSTAVTEVALRYPRPRTIVEAPLSLTASDGSGLELVALDAEAVVQGPLAFTELRLRFRNPEAREREGTFRVALPATAAVSRLAMRIDTRWQEAEVVELARARAVYEDFLHRKQDPALLEKTAGNEVSARVFPIPPNADKELLIAYSQEVAGRYVLSLRGLPAVESLRIRARVLQADGGVAEQRFEQRFYQPEADFEVAANDRVGALSARGSDGIERAVVRVAAPVPAEPRRGERWAIVVDTSASRALGFREYTERVEALLRALAGAAGADAEVAVAAFDQRVTSLHQGTLGEAPTRLGERLLLRQPLGASSLEAALDWLAAQPADHAVMVGDAVATAGAGERSALVPMARERLGRYRRLDFVLAGGIRDELGARELATLTLTEPGVVLELADSPAEVAGALTATTASRTSLTVEGAEFWWPVRLDGLHAGASRLVFVERPMTRAGEPLAVKIGGAAPRRVVAEPLLASAPLLDRALAAARIEALEEARAHALDGAERDRLRNRIVALSTHGRVLSEHTALLVLETEADYARFGIDRQRAGEVLIIGPGGVELRPSDPPLVVAGGHDAERASDREEPAASGGVAPAPAWAVPRGPTSGPAPVAPAADSQHEGYAYEFSDDPLQGTTLDPDAATIRVRPGPLGTGGMQTAEDFLPRSRVLPYAGRLATVMDLLARRDHDGALVEAIGWRNEDPGDVMALLGLGEALEARGQLELAARAYGSIVDLFPARADMRRFAAGRLDRLGPAGAALAVDAYRVAAAQRPDHPSGQRMLAYALLRGGQPALAFATLERALERDLPSNRHGARVLGEDLGLVAAAWAARDPSKRAEIERRLRPFEIGIADEPSTRFVLTWETDANDVDLHVVDERGEHAYFGHPRLASGGELYEDVTDGYGPECFTIAGRAAAHPYEIVVHYYARGPMGYGLGKVEVIEHDGKGGLAFRQLPFVVMNDESWVELGKLNGPMQ